MIAVSNRPKFTDPTGRNAGANFSEFEMAAASIVKDKYSNVDPSISAKLTKVTDGLLRRYEVKKNSYSKGFIPNFASRSEMIRDLIRFNLESTPDVKNKNVFGSKTTLFRGVKNRGGRYSGQFGRDIFEQSNNYSQAKNSFDYFRNTDINEIANDHVSEKKLLPFVSASMDEDIAKYFARGRQDSSFSDEGKVGSKTIKNSRIFSAESIRKFTNKYGQEALKQLMMEHSTWGSFGSGKGIAMNFQSFSDKKGFEGTDFAKEISFLSKGFVPNFANFIDVDTLGKNSVHYSGDLMKLIKDIESSIGRNLTSGELRFLSNPKTNLSKLNDPKVLNRFINSERKGGFAGFAKGFLPNFAYKQAIMGLEESMSGNKAIFDTKPFPHIRNSSQPTFSSAIADHGGLGNALSDSMRGQKAAGLMSRGFVPNFATRPYRYSGRGSVVDPSSSISQYSASLGLGLADQERRAKEEFNKIINALRTGAMNAQQATTAFNTLNAQAGLSARAQTNLTRILDREVNAAATASTSNTAGGAGGSRFSRFSRGLSRAGTAISIAGPTIAGFAEQSFFGDRKRSEMSSNERMAQSFASTGLSAVTTGVGIGAQAAGLPGALIGGAIGGLVAFKSALDSTSLSVDELKEKKEEEKNKTIENISSAERYLAIQEEISKSTSPKDIKNNLISLRKELSSIKDTDFADKIKIAGTDINALSEIVKQYSLKQKEATSVLNDSIIVQKKYSLETLKSAANVKITGQGGSGKLAQTGKFLTGSYNMIAEFLGFKNIREEEMARVDLTDKKTRETIYKENPNLFRTLSKIDPDALIEVGNVFASEVASNIGFGSFQTEELSKLLKQGGLQGSELEETIAVLKQAGDSSNLLGNALANNFFVAVNGFKKFDISQQTQLKNTENAAEAIADLNQQLKDFINNLDYAFKDLNRQNDFEKKLRGVQAPNRMMISESLYGKRDAIETQRYLDIKDVESERESKNLDISKKLLTTNIQDYYNLSDAQKTAYLQLSKSFDLSKPEENLKKIEGFIQNQFGTLDTITATEKQKNYLTLISNVRKDIAQTEKESADDLYLAAEKFKEALMAMELSRDFVFQFKAGFRDLATEGEMLIGTIGRQLPKMFADGLVDGIKAAIRESDNLGQALMGIASKFLDEISTMMMRSSIYQIMGSFAPSLAQGYGSASAIPVPRQKGGIIRAQSGMYISGSGSGDKYPALLENGEYVLNRRAVMAMGGPASLDQLNFAMAPRFASGGSFGNEFTDLKSMESNMTSYGMENSKLYNELRDAEMSAAEERRRKAFARRQQRAALIGSAVAAVASIGLSAGVSNLSQNKLSAQAGALSGTQQAKDVATMPIPKGQSFAGSEVAQFVTPKQYGQINSLMRQGYLNSAGTSTTQSYSGFKGFFTGPTAYGQVPWYQRGSMNPFAPKIGGKQTGGLIGSRLSDTIPGYMEGGLYNTPMVKRYGVGMQSGGMSPVSNSNSNVVNTTNATNSFNFNTNVSRDGTIEVGSNSTSYAQQDVALSKNLNSKVYAVVLDAIKNEQRFGGSLAGTRQG
jgi:hypothetical protein